MSPEAPPSVPVSAEESPAPSPASPSPVSVPVPASPSPVSVPVPASPSPVSVPVPASPSPAHPPSTACWSIPNWHRYTFNKALWAAISSSAAAVSSTAAGSAGGSTGRPSAHPPGTASTSAPKRHRYSFSSASWAATSSACAAANSACSCALGCAEEEAEKPAAAKARQAPTAAVRFINLKAIQTGNASHPPPPASLSDLRIAAPSSVPRGKHTVARRGRLHCAALRCSPTPRLFPVSPADSPHMAQRGVCARCGEFVRDAGSLCARLWQ